MAQSERIGFLFPGQGAQYTGMGKDLYESDDAARKIYRRADDSLGYSLSEICFQGPEEKITRTLYAQPAIFVTSYAVLCSLQNKFPDLKPAFSAGLSLGEFTALTVAGALTFEEGLKLVALRAEAMEEAAKNNPGTMASILGFPQEECEATVKEAGCQVANLNSPEQFVISGTVKSVEKACALAEQRGAKRALRLKVGGAFHSALMLSAKTNLERALSKASLKAPQGIFIPNASARPVSDPVEIKILLAKQLVSPVRWIETMQRAFESGISQYLEIGPGKVLKGLAKKCQPSLTVWPCGTTEDLQKMDELLKNPYNSRMG